jgi:hypothetical protein
MIVTGTHMYRIVFGNSEVNFEMTYDGGINLKVLNGRILHTVSTNQKDQETALNQGYNFKHKTLTWRNLEWLCRWKG